MFRALARSPMASLKKTIVKFKVICTCGQTQQRLNVDGASKLKEWEMNEKHTLDLLLSVGIKEL